MRQCPKCSDGIEDSESVCPSCGHRSAPLQADEPDVLADPIPGTGTPATMRVRPDGKGPITIGWIALALAGMLVLLTFITPTDTLEAGATKWMMLVMSGVLFQLFLLFWGIGSIIRAIWFLPADASRNLPETE